MKINSSISNYSEAQFYRFFYKGNESARISENRSNFPKSTLISSDSNALHRAIETFSGIFDGNDASGKEIFHAIKAFTSTYNNVLDSSSSTDAHEIASLRKSIKGLSSKEQKELEMIGITVKQSGKLSVDEDKLKQSNPERVKKIFSKDSEFMKKLNKYARKLETRSSASGSILDVEA